MSLICGNFINMTKSDLSYKGGKITNIRLATDDEIVEHQILMAKNGKDPMQNTYARKVVAFSVDPNWNVWNVRWPQDGKVRFMAYKSIGYIDMDDTSNI